MRRTSRLGVAAALLLSAACGGGDISAQETDAGKGNESDAQVKEDAAQVAPASDAAAADDGAEPRSNDAGLVMEDGGVDDPDPEISAEARAALKALHYGNGKLPADPSNKYADNAKAQAFGQRLFFDPSFSGTLLERDNDGSAATLGKTGDTGRVSCAGCHVPSAGFVDNRSPHKQISLAARWTRRRTPTLIETGFVSLYNWDGRRDTLWNQAIGVFESKDEFNSSRLFIAEQAYRVHKAEYESVFGAMPKLDDAKLYPQLTAAQAGCEAGPDATAPCRGKPGDKADYDGMSGAAQKDVTTVTVNLAKALAAYMRQLRCGPGAFEKWLDGDSSALSRSAQRGAALFVGKAKCVSCHSGSNLTDNKFHNVGLRPATVAVAFTDTGDRGAAEGMALAANDPLGSAGAFSDGDRGMLPATVGAEMEGAFRTPSLRCVSTQPSFMHTAQFNSLAQVMRFFSKGGDSAGYPGKNELVALSLSEREQADLVEFMNALKGTGPAAVFLAPPK